LFSEAAISISQGFFVNFQARLKWLHLEECKVIGLLQGQGQRRDCRYKDGSFVVAAIKIRRRKSFLFFVDKDL
jgi:hypothetical protein